jgi:N-acetyl-anhydromuramyl-L-alanine amidase AmpD
MTPITRITVHHTAIEFGQTAPGVVAAEMRQLQSSHQAKWADLGYHFLIDQGGGIWEGRQLKWQGAHEGVGLNQGSIGICLMGNFDRESVPKAQLAALADLLGACCGRFALRRSDIKTHREVRQEPTDCPGQRLQAWLDSYRRSTDVVSLARQ